MGGKPESVLCIMSHPDDAEIWCGGTLVLHAQHSPVAVLVATSDKLRLSEAHRSAEILGVDLVVRKNLTVENCATEIKKRRPSIVICHRVDDVHIDHRHAAECAMSAVIETHIAVGHPSSLYCCDTYNSLTLTGNVPGSRIIDITESFGKKIAALSEHKSQPLDHFIAMARRQAGLWGGRIGCEWGEAFDPIPILGKVPGLECLG
jgi:LmbE family N-acetylglucosaminyl deacetylase